MSGSGMEVIPVKTKEEVWRQAYEDLEWARNSKRLRKKHLGKVVAVNKRKVISHGERRPDVLKEAMGKGYSRAELAVVCYLAPNTEIPPDTVIPQPERPHGNRPENPA